MDCLETSFLIDLLNGEKGALDKYLKIKDKQLSTTSITAFELMRFSEKGKESFDETKRLLQRLDIFGFGMNEAEESALVEKELLKEGKPINSLDILIAGIARKNGLILITNDKDFRKVRNLKIETY